MKKSINWSYFPKTDPLPEVLNETINIFEKNHNKIDSTKNDTNKLRLSSDKVLKVVEEDFIDAGFSVETGKKKDEKIRVPVLYGHQGTIAQAFEVDGWHKEQKIVLEIACVIFHFAGFFGAS